MKTPGRLSEEEDTNIPEHESSDELESLAEAVDAAIRSIKDDLGSDKLKPSISDLVRLIQLRKELMTERVRDVTVRWIDPCGTGANEE